MTQAASASERLAHIIALAAKWEQLPLAGPRSIRAVGLGTAVRARRLAEAIRILGPEYGYEARLQVRTMLELYFNYAWIRLKRPHSRAIRFLRFQPLEKLRLSKDLVRLSPERERELAPHIARLEKQRATLRYLFRSRDAKGKMRWARDWAGGRSLESRLDEVLAASRASGKPVDNFLYALYRWLSGAVHGSAQSFDDVLTADRSVRAKTNEELKSEEEQDAASASLLAIWSIVARDLRLPRAVSNEAKVQLRELVKTLRESALAP